MTNSVLEALLWTFASIGLLIVIFGPLIYFAKKLKPSKQIIIWSIVTFVFIFLAYLNK